MSRSPNPTSNRLPAVDALRGIACLWVTVLHFQYGLAAAVVPKGDAERVIASASILGYAGVNLFLVLSGFCLTFPLARKGPPQEWRLDLPLYGRRRLLRIYPPYLVCVLASIAVTTAFGPRLFMAAPAGWPDVLAHVSLVHNLWTEYVVTLNGPLWTIALESQLYVAFPLVLWVVRHTGIWSATAITLALSIIWTYSLGSINRLENEVREGFTLWNALPARLFDFTCGIAAARLVTIGGRHTRMFAAITALVALVAAIWVALPAPGPVWIGQPFAAPQHWLWAPGFAALLVFGCLSRFPRIFAPLDWLGIISYSVYLVHCPVLSGCREAGMSGWASLPLVLTVVVASGLLFHYIVERPFMKLR